jgi:hypothetical protein
MEVSLSAILNDQLSQKSSTLYKEVTPGFIDPDVKLELTNMKRDLDYFHSQGLVESKTIGANDILELSFVNQTLKELGLYKGRKV